MKEQVIRWDETGRLAMDRLEAQDGTVLEPGVILRLACADTFTHMVAPDLRSHLKMVPSLLTCHECSGGACGCASCCCRIGSYPDLDADGYHYHAMPAEKILNSWPASVGWLLHTLEKVRGTWDSFRWGGPSRDYCDKANHGEHRPDAHCWRCVDQQRACCSVHFPKELVPVVGLASGKDLMAHHRYGSWYSEMLKAGRTPEVGYGGPSIFELRGDMEGFKR